VSLPQYVLDWTRLPGVGGVLAAIRVRMEQGRLSKNARIPVRLPLSERKNIGQMLDVTWAGSGKDLSVAALRAGLEQGGVTLEDVLVAIGGPLRDLPAQRRERDQTRRADRAAGLDQLISLLGVPVPEQNGRYVEEALARWVLRKEPPRERADEVTRIVTRLPTSGGTRLAVVAAGLTGDAHALDRSRKLGRAVVRFLALRTAVSAGGTDLDVDPVSSADTWRRTWADAHVLCDSVSARVLVLNLPLIGTAPAVALCAATPGEPVWLSLRSLTGPFSLSEPTDVYVCENPTIVEAAADRLGASARPLVCTFGRPDASAMTLLHALAPDARLHVRADADPAGWSIVDSLLLALPGAVLWRMPRGQTCYEEELVDDLIDDLAPAGCPWVNGSSASTSSF